MKNRIRENLSRVRANVAGAAARTGRDPQRVKLLAVTKTIPAEVIRESLDFGVDALGENRVQEILAKQPLLPPGIEWHLIGTLQTNKIKSILGRVHLIHSLDRWGLAEELSRRSVEAGLVSRVLIQVNISGEATKSGLFPDELVDFISDAASLPGLQIKGLMTMAPYADNSEAVRPVFTELRLLAENISAKSPPAQMDYLSMGMSNDYTVAVEEGANIIRVGTAIFGARSY
ncbi:MAG: pyridoxal phosphate biosynthesis protein [Peptococcaceae bacterium BRH_c4b]|nr:MAG: pyridoxal phosphate biosynthesis protein [Peptococcaceae bacterium BRH_c4b]